SHFAVTFTAPPPLEASTVRLARSPWISSICCCIRCACFINFPMLDIRKFLVGFWTLNVGTSGANLDDLALEDLQCFLDQGIILEIIFAESDRRKLVSRRG